MSNKLFVWAIGIFAFILVVLFVKKQIEKEDNKNKNKKASKANVNSSQLEFSKDVYKNLAKRFIDAFKGVQFSSDDDSPRVTVMGEILLLNDDGIKETANNVVALDGETMRSWVENDIVNNDMKPNFLNRLSEIGI